MGIPGLATRLEPHASRVTSSELDGYVAIVDGPALAYFAHRLAADANKLRLPSYADINAVAINWLKNLEDINIKVSAILFDGALPTAKKDERSSRLLALIKRVAQHKAMHSSTYCPIPSQLGSAVYPLLAPSLMEELSSSQFAQVTRIVPGEADDWCALHAQTHPRSIVFSSDTDLIIYDYPEEVLVSFLKDVGNVEPELALKVYSPSAIQKQLNLESLLPLAYSVHNDRWKSLKDNVIEARDQDVQSSLYLEFSRRYMSKVDPQSQQPSHSTELEYAIQELDVRVSEVVLQALSIGPPSTVQPPLALSVFLPLLLEDPFQASAWSCGQDLRLLAYSLLAPRRVAIQEYTRKAQGVSTQDLSIYTSSQATTRATELTQTFLTSPVDMNAGLPPPRYWKLFAIHLALAGALKPPHISLLTRVATDEFDNTWAFIHLQACIQAQLYSLRMLKQCITVRLALDHSRSSSAFISNLTRNPTSKQLDPMSPDLSAAVRLLNKCFSYFPPISEMFSVPGQTIIPHKSSDDKGLPDLMRDVYMAAGIEDRELFEDPKSKKERKRARKETRGNKVQKAVQAPPKQLSSNAFAVLGQGIAEIYGMCEVDV